jgi:hypothetical protein
VTSLSVSTLTTPLFTANGIEGSIHRTRDTCARTLLRAGVIIRVVREFDVVPGVGGHAGLHGNLPARAARGDQPTGNP